MCHDALEVILNPNVNFIIGRNGSGKSAILTALTVGLGGRATITSRGASVKSMIIFNSLRFFIISSVPPNFSFIDFIKKGKNSAIIEVMLLNTGPMAYKSDIYGDTITITRNIGNASTYKIRDWKGL